MAKNILEIDATIVPLKNLYSVQLFPSKSEKGTYGLIRFSSGEEMAIVTPISDDLAKDTGLISIRDKHNGSTYYFNPSNLMAMKVFLETGKLDGTITCYAHPHG